MAKFKKGDLVMVEERALLFLNALGKGSKSTPYDVPIFPGDYVFILGLDPTEYIVYSQRHGVRGYLVITKLDRLGVETSERRPGSD